MNQLPQYRTIESLVLLVDEDLTATEVARIRGKQYAAARKVLRGLLEGGYVAKTLDTVDVDNPRFAITDAGRELMAEVERRGASRREAREKWAARREKAAERSPAGKRTTFEIPGEIQTEPWARWMYVELVVPRNLPCS